MKDRIRYLWLVLAVASLVVISCAQDSPTGESGGAGDSTATTEAPSVEAPSRISGEAVGSLAPRIQGISSWINSEPLQITDLRGQVVLVDFWTYTCVNCIRTFPFLKEWHSKYADKGLVILGIHTPEFEFEKKRTNVITAAKEYGLLYPVAQDNDFDTWDAFENRYWPAKYLIDKDGVIRYTHFGEGAYDETEQKIRELLEEAGASLDTITAGVDSGPEADSNAFTGGLETGLTREIYGGYERNNSFYGAYVTNVEYYEGPNMEIFYEDPGDHENQFMYLQGVWVNGLESLIHGRETENYEDYIALKFFATSVNVVLNPEESEPFNVLITMDGKPLDEESKGADVVFDEDGNSFILVDVPRLYRLVEVPEYGGHELKLSSNSSAFSLFAFTFGAYDEGP